MIRWLSWRTIVHTSRSGRRRSIRLTRAVPQTLGLLGCLGAVFAALPVYSPVVHALSGDPVPRLSAQSLTRKVALEHRAALVNLLSVVPPRSDAASPLPTFRLWANADSLGQLDREILTYGFGAQRKPRTGGESLEPDGLRRVRLSYRGTNSWHHQAWKPSLRVRYGKGELRDGFRNHALLSPKDAVGLFNWLSTELARRWGMLTNGEHHVRVFLNRRYLGLYTRLWRFDESLLIRERRLPGPFFRLEGNTGPVFARNQARFESPRTWEVEGVEPHVGWASIRQFTEAVRHGDAEVGRQQLNDVLDRESMARYLAILCHSGEARVAYSNVAFWLDPATGRLVPIPVDPGGYNPQWAALRLRPVLLAQNAHTEAWLEDPLNLALYVERLQQLLTGHGSAESVIDLVEAQWERIRPDALADENMSALGPDGTLTRTLYPLTQLDDWVAGILGFVRQRCAFLQAQLDDVRLFRLGSTPEGEEVVVMGLAGAIASPRGTEGSKRTLLPSLSRLARQGSRIPYGLHTLPGSLDDYTWRHRLSGKTLKLEPAPAGLADRLREGRGATPPPALPSRPPEAVTLGPGEVVLEEDLELLSGQALTVAAGTRLLLGPEVSIFARGPVRVDGRQDAPVVVRPLDPDRPFGVLAILGPQTGGTRIQHLDLEGGSTRRRLNLELTGMLSIHECPDLRIEQSRFGPNAAGDDGVHLIRCRAVLETSLFEGALSDAVDWDRVQGQVRDCLFMDAGNDGLDLSLSDVTVSDCRFVRCGDKGVSVGEGSRVSVSQASFHGSGFGVAVKDDSELRLEQAQFVDCQVAVGLYRKKWRWERGGRVWLRDCEFAGSQVADLQGDQHSVLRIVGPWPRPLTHEGRLTVEPATEWPGD